MKRSFAAACITALALGSGASAIAAGLPSLSHDSHHAADSGLSQLELDQGRRWATDEPLRRNMSGIGAVLATERDDILAGRLSTEQARPLGEAIEARVIAILTECKLDRGADTNLHLIVAELVQSADVLLGKSKGRAGRAAQRAVRATQMYATYFDHPGWTRVY